MARRMDKNDLLGCAFEENWQPDRKGRIVIGLPVQILKRLAVTNKDVAQHQWAKESKAFFPIGFALVDKCKLDLGIFGNAGSDVMPVEAPDDARDNPLLNTGNDRHGIAEAEIDAAL